MAGGFVTLGDYKDWLEGFLTAANMNGAAFPLNSQQENIIFNKCMEISDKSQRIRAYEYLLKPLLTTNCYESIN